jgi:hypothetical protein
MCQQITWNFRVIREILFEILLSKEKSKQNDVTFSLTLLYEAAEFEASECDCQKIG